MKIFKATLALLLATGMLMAGTAGPVLADGHGHGDHGRNQQNNPYQYGQNGNQNDGNGGDDNGRSGNDDHGGRGNGNNCVNSGGNGGSERGSCNQNGYYGNRNVQNSQLQGIVTSVRNGRVSILQGLSTITFDAARAIRYNNTNGALYPSRSITAYGYYDNNHYFHANAIR
ncbi:MAG: hypothetical protein ACYDGW_05055 [Vulcanimicrobiaceae bacterium]